MTGNLLPGPPFSSTLENVLGNQHVPTIRLAMLRPFCPAHWLNLEERSIELAKTDADHGVTNLLEMLPQHDQARLVCCLGLHLYVVELCTPDTSPISNNSDLGIWHQ